MPRTVPLRIGLNAGAAGVATLVDCAVAVALVSTGLGAAAATAAGCLVGAIGNFAFNRAITFRSTAAPWRRPAATP